ncbi:hypothetical protein [Porphyromonas macacae]|uniref:hypothetical protein n=1 Tax=Porphyromonas macacae TaxID=28115 RepID=UPI0035A18CDF
MEDRKKQERSFELRSEKVRSIVGQIPPSLVRYGITVIGAVLLCLFMIGYFLPYKQVYSGTAVVHGIAGESKTDSMEITLLLRFDGQRMNGGNNLSQPVFLQTEDGTLSGQLLQLSSLRDTLQRQEALGRFNAKKIKSVEHQTVDFRIIRSSGNLLQKMLGGL